MKSKNKGLAIKLAVTSTIAITCLVPAQPASAQILELASGALSIFNSLTGKSKPQPQPAPPPVVIPQRPMPAPIPDFTVGADNLNGNTINLCISGCLPNATQAIPPRPNTFNTFPPTNTIPPGTVAQPATPVPPQPAPAPNRPVLTIPPISLPPSF